MARLSRFLLSLSLLGGAWLLPGETVPDSMNPSLEPLRPTLNAWIEEGTLPNVAVMVVSKDQVLLEHHAGILDQELDTLLQRDSLFRIYSMTKPITALAAMMLVEQGELELDESITSVLPEFANLEVWSESGSMKSRPMTLRHLLSHTAGLTYGYYGDTPVDRMYREAGLIDDWDYLVPTTHDLVVGLGRLPLLFQPGSRFHYSFASDVVGQVVERVSGQTLDTYLQEHLWEPLGVVDAYFDVPDHLLERFGTNHYPNPAGGFVVQDSPREDPEFRDVSFLSGGGGLVMTIDSFSRFAQLLVGEGVVGEKRLVNKETIQQIFTNQLPVDSNSQSFRYGLGLGIRTVEDSAGKTRDLYYWGGAAGTSFWIDPTHSVSAIFMTQLIGGTDEPLNQFNEFVVERVPELAK